MIQSLVALQGNKLQNVARDTRTHAHTHTHTHTHTQTHQFPMAYQQEVGGNVLPLERPPFPRPRRNVFVRHGND